MPRKRIWQQPPDRQVDDLWLVAVTTFRPPAALRPNRRRFRRPPSGSGRRTRVGRVTGPDFGYTWALGLVWSEDRPTGRRPRRRLRVRPRGRVCDRRRPHELIYYWSIPFFDEMIAFMEDLNDPVGEALRALGFDGERIEDFWKCWGDAGCELVEEGFGSPTWHPEFLLTELAYRAMERALRQLGVERRERRRFWEKLAQSHAELLTEVVVSVVKREWEGGKERSAAGSKWSLYLPLGPLPVAPGRSPAPCSSASACP